MAVNRKFDKDKKADFIDIVAWRNNAEFVSKYFKKGQQIVIVGSLQVRSWKDKDGNSNGST
jgi:single-strand DNA-binding protein